MLLPHQVNSVPACHTSKKNHLDRVDHTLCRSAGLHTIYSAFLRGTYYGDGLELFWAVDEILKAIVLVAVRSPNSNYESVGIALAMLCRRG